LAAVWETHEAAWEIDTEGSISIRMALMRLEVSNEASLS